jgi:hypothetical protein
MQLINFAWNNDLKGGAESCRKESRSTRPASTAGQRLNPKYAMLATDFGQRPPLCCNLPLKLASMANSSPFHNHEVDQELAKQPPVKPMDTLWGGGVVNKRQSSMSSRASLEASIDALVNEQLTKLTEVKPIILPLFGMQESQIL